MRIRPRCARATRWPCSSSRRATAGRAAAAKARRATSRRASCSTICVAIPTAGSRSVDSLDLGGEVAGGGALVAVNLFARSDPSGGSWPYLFWREGAGVHAQAIDGGGSRLLDVAVRDVPGPTLGQIAASQAAILFTRAGSTGQQPLVLVWARPAGGNTWNLAQTLGVDSLGGVGNAQFVNASSDSTALVARSYRSSAGFDECATCPHVYRMRKFRWGPSGFVGLSNESVDSPYATFVQFVTALTVNDRELAIRHLSDPLVLEAAIAAGWGQLKGRWRVSPGTEGTSSEIVFFRGTTEAYRVRFERRDGQWLISDFQSTSRSIE
jgi:hypothetical protein